MYVPPNMRNIRTKSSDQVLNDKIERVSKSSESDFPSLNSNFQNQKQFNGSFFSGKAQEWKQQKAILEETLEFEKARSERIQKRQEAEKEQDDFNNRFSKKHPKVIHAVEIKESNNGPSLPKIINTSPKVVENGEWIDPYKAKRLKNKIAKDRREIRRQENLLKEPEDVEIQAQKVEIEESLWDEY
jgi:hypothetical protein